MAEPAWDVFLSYAPGDARPAATIADGLAAHGLRCWRVDGEVWGTDEELAALRGSRIALELVGETGLFGWGRTNLQQLIARADRPDLVPLAVLLPAAPPEFALPEWLSRRQAVDLRGRKLDDGAISEIASAASSAESAPVEFSSGAQLALGFAAALLRGAPDAGDPGTLSTAALLGALHAGATTGMQPSTGDVVRLILERQSGRGVDEVIAAAAAAARLEHPGTAVGADRDPRASPAAPIAAAAAEASARTRAGVVHLRHVLATGIAEALPPAVLLELGVTLDELAGAALDAIARTWPDEPRAAWEELLAVRATPPSFELAGGFSADAVDPNAAIPLERDQLGVSVYVSMLAATIADRSTPMPLSIGLFGDWGSGKSTFMGLLRGKVDQLTRSGSPAYYRHIRQIGFNAWHYADTNLWASLAQEIFEELAGARNPDPEQRAALEREWAQLSEARRQLEEAAGHAKAETERLHLRLDAAQAERLKSARALLAALAQTETVKHELDAAWKRLGVDGEIEQAQQLADELRRTGAETRDVRWGLEGFGGRALAVVGAVTALAVLAFAVAALVVSRWAAGGGLAAVAAILGLGLGALRRFRTGVQKLHGAVAEIRANPPQAELAALRRAEAAQQVTEAQLDQVVARMGEIGRERAELSAGRRLYAFVSERAAGDDYRRHLGLISTIRRDFERLVDLMDDWRRRAQQDESAPQPIDRIVLYIDDLDRCSPQQVVDVLQAVHLLLAFELFVVVVGVDPRWLLRSLRTRYRELLTTETASEGDGWQASPLDYLEKIFNVPFALPRMSRRGFGRLIASLARDGVGALPQPSVPIAATPAAPTGAEPAPDEPESIAAEARSEAAAIERGEAPLADVRQLTDDELAILTALAPLVETPREAKRLVNLYRMIRTTRDLSSASTFLGQEGEPGQYQAVAVLLGIVSGAPHLLEAVLAAPSRPDLDRAGGLLHRDPATAWRTFHASMKPEKRAGGFHNGVLGALSPEDVTTWEAQHAALADATELVTLADLTAFQLWAPRVVRFSFVQSLATTAAGLDQDDPRALRART